jgi:hypothetical protein
VKARRTVEFPGYLPGFVGAALVAGLVISQRVTEVARPIAGAGWALAAAAGLHTARLLSPAIGHSLAVPNCVDIALALPLVRKARESILTTPGLPAFPLMGAGRSWQIPFPLAKSRSAHRLTHLPTRACR